MIKKLMVAATTTVCIRSSISRVIGTRNPLFAARNSSFPAMCADSADRLSSSDSKPSPETKTSDKYGLKDIQTWTEHYKNNIGTPSFKDSEDDEKLFSPKELLNDKVSLWKGDITTLEIDAIVNAANSSLLGGGGVDGAIHKAAGEELREECETLNGCESGDAKITLGYKLPAKHVIHTVGPIGEKPETLKSCYQKVFQLLLDKNLRSTAIPCISTGIYGYPNEQAAHVALLQTRKYLELNPDKVDRVIFCVFLDKDWEIYQQLMQRYFPVNTENQP